MVRFCAESSRLNPSSALPFVLGGHSTRPLSALADLECASSFNTLSSSGINRGVDFYALGGQRSVVGPERVSACACCREDRVAHPYSDGFASFGGGDCAQRVFRFVQADGEVFRLQRFWSPAMLGNLPDDLLTQLGEVHRDRLAQEPSTSRFVGVEERE